ncbi:MAG: two-component system sensor histidine kinase NtrB [Rhodanobacteraceae bacterium]
MARTNPDLDPIEHLSTGVVWLDDALRVVRINVAFAERTGIGSSRLTGRTLASLKPDGERLQERAQRALDDHVTRVLPNVAVCAAPGSEARLDFTFTPFTGGVLVEAHPAAPASGATRVSESLRGFAHEVRNPLAAISGAAQLLEQGAGDARQRELARLIRAESDRLASLSGRLLGTRTAMPTRAVNLHALLERVIELVDAGRGDVEIVRDYDPTLPAWHGDPDHLLQAVLNLSRNALEAHARRVVLRSRAEAGWRDARGQSVPALRIEVEDDGDGVPDALATTLFEPMVTGRVDGTGLGLALAREIAREHGGDLTWQPRGHGSRFVLWLPRYPRAGEPA